MLHNEARRLLVEAYERSHNAKEVASNFGVKPWEVYHLAKQMRETGSVDLRTSQRGRKPVLSSDDLQRVKNAVEEKPDITMKNLKEQLNLPISERRLAEIVKGMGFRRKKKVIHASEQERPDVQEKRAHWKKTIAQITPEKLVFLDESGVNTNMTPRYGRAMGGQRVVDSTPFSTPKSTTVLSAIRLEGQFACTLYEGGTTKSRFVDYVRDTLLPDIHEGDFVVMDNLRAHHAAEVRELILAKNAYPVYLPPYSPDLNPIEKMWSKMKTLLRSLKPRSPEQLRDAVLSVLSRVTPSDCAGWFQCAGYCV